MCVGYGDFLREVAAFNRPLLSRWIVVTASSDDETRHVCRQSSIECVAVEDAELTRDGDFSKGRLIDRGHAMLGGHAWTLHLDADVALPADLHQVLGEAHLDERCIYGCDRLNVTGREAWAKVKSAGLFCRQNPWAVHLSRPGVAPGTRVANHGHGYTPIGFFQLWHGEASLWKDSHTRRYPVKHGTAARTDVQHALQWDRRHRVLIPELVVWHLESEPAPMGANWKGRRTARFGQPATARVEAVAKTY